ncbi:PREDICTED: uncharacterized protein LOC109467910 [Branchiostoma belcheri]|uniref:Uncharacterized protein LOC109467910 n=1 Tax=Branchiostoma belcheri TaxID=7741 RepID=A0A6P4YI61_BRABE|nr:PREDICTED: uncharacterized protein LOC109467910 [Branchiostoma belcheri]
MNLARENEELSRDVMKLQSALDMHHRQVDSENKSVRGMMRKAISGARWQTGAQGKLTTFKSISDIEDDVLGDIENSRMEKKRAMNKRPPSGRQPAAIKNSSVPKESTLLHNQGTKGSVGREPAADQVTAAGNDKISERKPVIRDNICERETRHIEGQNPALGFIGMDVAQPSKILKRPSSASGTRGQKAGKPKGVLIDRKHRRSQSTQGKETGADNVVNGKRQTESTQKVSFDTEVKDAEEESEEPEVQIVTTGKTYQDRLVSMRAKVLNDKNNDQVHSKPQHYMSKTISAKLKSNSAPPAASNNHTRRRGDTVVRSEFMTSCDPAVAAWLASLNLMEQEKYVRIFAENEIDLEGLRLLSEDQLARMGVTAIGAMNKIMFGVEQLRNSFDKAKEKSAKTVEPTVERKETVKAKPFSAGVTRRPASSGTKSVDVVPKERKSKRPVSADVVRRSRAGVKLAAQKASHRQQEEERQKRQKERMEQRKKAERDKMAARFLEKKKEAELREEMTAEDRGSSGASNSPESTMELEDIESNIDSSRATSQASTWSREPQGISLTLEGLGLGKSTPRGGESEGPDTGTRRDPGGRKDPEHRPDTGSRTNRSGQREHVPAPVDVELQVSGLQQRGKENEQTAREIVDKIQRQLEEIQMVYKSKSPTSPHNMAAQSHAGKDPGEEMDVPESSGNKREVGSGRSVAMATSPSKQDLMRQLRKEQDKHRKEIRHLESELKRLKFKDPLRSCQIAEKDIIYSTKDLLGEGAFSRVFRGVYNGTEVAVKRLRSPLSAADKNYFGAEVSLLRELRHPRVVLLLGVCTAADLPIMVLEYMAQGSLYHWLHGENRPDLDHVLYYQIARDTSLGMNYLHNRKPAVLHLDLKSMNVLLDSQLRAKIADFGFSKLRHDADVKASQSGHLRGTPAWMAPELINQGNITTKVDVYSFGMILWEMLTRKHPYLGLSMFQVMECVRLNQRPDIPDYCPIGLSRLIGLCWAHNPARRPSFKDILISLESLSFPPEWRSLLSAAGIPRQAMEDANSAQRIIHLVSNSVVLSREDLEKAAVTGEVPRSDDQGLDTAAAKLTNSNTEHEERFTTGGNPWAGTKLDLDFGSSSDDEAACQGNHVDKHGVSDTAMAQSLTKRTYKILSPRREEPHKVRKSVHIPKMWKGTWVDSEDRPEVEASDSGSEDSLEASIQSASRDSDPKSVRDTGARMTGKIVPPPPPPPPVADYQKHLLRTSYVRPENQQLKNKGQQSKENSVGDSQAAANRHKRGPPKTTQPIIPASVLQEQKQRLKPVDLTRPQELPDISRVGQDRLSTIAEILKKAVGERREAMNMADDIHSMEQSYSAVWSVDN